MWGKNKNHKQSSQVKQCVAASCLLSHYTKTIKEMGVMSGCNLPYGPTVSNNLYCEHYFSL